MLENNNSRIVTRMAVRSIKSGRQKNLIMAAAITLSTFMLFCILTVGSTYFKMQRLQNIRMNGADYDAFIYGGFTEEQKEICEKNPYIQTVGVQGMAGWTVSTDTDDTLNTVMLWSDGAQWDVLSKPAVIWQKGEYPLKENEVMATAAALKDCGLEDAGVGDTFTLTYGDKQGEHTAEFTISGLLKTYKNEKIFYVSKPFLDKSGFSLDDYGRGFLYMKFKYPVVPERVFRELENSLNLGEQQYLLIEPAAQSSVQILAGLAGLVLITCFSAYLLIYNILYISVSSNVRHYGLLQTVGMTGRQIYQMVLRQMFMVGACGIAGGILLGMLTSFLLIPEAVKVLGIQKEEISIAFHPAVFLLSILIAGGTIYLGSRKPAKKATEVSPVEALGYRGDFGKRNSHGTRKGRLVWRLAWDQVTKDKKKTMIVLLSLAASLSVFLCLTTLIESQGPRTIVSNYMDADMVLINDTIKKDDKNDWKQLMDEAFQVKIKEGGRIKESHQVLIDQIVVPWEPEFVDTWMKAFYVKWMEESYADIETEFKQNPEKFSSYIIGIDEAAFTYLNSTLETPIDEQSFKEGKSCILYRDSLNLKEADYQEENIACYLYGGDGESHSFQIGGLTDDSYYRRGGITPTIIVSDAYLNRISDAPYVFKTSIQYEQEYDTAAEADVKNAIDTSAYPKDFSYESKIEEMKSVSKAQGNMMGIGIGIAFILALIGILNYVNTVTGNIHNRQMELAIMESVGMTEKQVKSVLIREGILFAGGSLVLTATLGLFITYLLYQSMNYMQVTFAIPVLPSACMILFILCVCVAVPLAVYRVVTGKKAIVERIKTNE